MIYSLIDLILLLILLTAIIHITITFLKTSEKIFFSVWSRLGVAFYIFSLFHPYLISGSKTFIPSVIFRGNTEMRELYEKSREILIKNSQNHTSLFIGYLDGFVKVLLHGFSFIDSLFAQNLISFSSSFKSVFVTLSFIVLFWGIFTYCFGDRKIGIFILLSSHFLFLTFVFFF
eukprot:Anaeramoba_ignava/a229779_12.p1 GENE.a229779_12~~a229779_12.p1  ORF type:complete len:174 (-),score=44.08 a229779_12:85-606(-)